MQTVLWMVLAAAAMSAAAVWGRSVRYRARVVAQLDQASGDGDLKRLARAGLRKDVHAVVLYLVVTVLALVGAAGGANGWLLAAGALVLVPAGFTVALGRTFVADARTEMGRSQLERRAQEVLVQEQLAPRRWAERLAPAELPDIDGLEVGSAYQPGAGMLAGDFYDVVAIDAERTAVVIGDVSGHGIEPAITAFQAKYLLRVFVRRFRDPAQALEELNAQLSSMGRPDEFVSLCLVVHDSGSQTVRYASAGHPPGWLWHERDVVPLGATGPLLMLDPAATYRSRELDVDSGDLLVVYTDGLAEARDGGQLFGEERIATTIRRDPGVPPDVLCKSLLEAATDFSSGPISDDVAILAIRRT